MRKQKIKHKEKLAKLSNKNLLTRAIIYSLIVIGSCFSIGFVPKQLFEDVDLYHYASESAIYEDDNDISLYEAKVYGTKRRFEKGLIEDVDYYKKDFKDNNRILLIRIPGETKSINYKEDFYIETNPKTPNLNIEIYVIRNVQYKNMSVGCETFITLADTVLHTVDLVYLILISIVHASLIIGFGIPNGLIIAELVKRQKQFKLKKENINI